MSDPIVVLLIVLFGLGFFFMFITTGSSKGRSSDKTPVIVFVNGKFFLDDKQINVRRLPEGVRIGCTLIEQEAFKEIVKRSRA